MFGNQPRFKICLLWFDIVIIIASLILAAKGIDGLSLWSFLFSLLYILPASLFSLLFNDLYKRNIVYTRYRQAVLVFKSIIIASIISFVVMAVLQFGLFVENGRLYLLRYFLFSVLIFIFLRALLVKKIMNFLSAKGFFNTNILIVGGDKTGVHVAETLENDKVFNFNVAGFIDDYKEIGEKINGKYENLGKFKDLDSFVKSKKINEILIAIDGLPYTRLIEIVGRCLSTGLVVRIYSDFLAVIVEKMNVEYYAGLPVVMLQQQSRDALSWKIKRMFDIIITSAALILLSPLFLLVAVCIKLSSRGPVIYKQIRIGKNGKPFEFYKFRSMHTDTSSSEHKEYVRNFIKGDSCSEKQDIKIFKIKDDPRIFPFGSFIRKTSIDEFPQLFNVIKGDMSLVGPRPCLPYEWECYDEWHKNRLNILPGCTGLWQVLGRSRVSFEEMVILDIYYVSNISMLLWLDIKIILQTFPVIFFGKGGF